MCEKLRHASPRKMGASRRSLRAVRIHAPMHCDPPTGAARCTKHARQRRFVELAPGRRCSTCLPWVLHQTATSSVPCCTGSSTTARIVFRGTTGNLFPTRPHPVNSTEEQGKERLHSGCAQRPQHNSSSSTITRCRQHANATSRPYKFPL